MARKRFGGRIFREPTVAGTFAVATPPGANPQSTGKVLFFGESSGGLGIDQVATLRERTGYPVYWFGTPQEAEAVLRDGETLRMIKKAFRPSPNYMGAQQVGYSRIAACTQASLALADANTHAVLLLTHYDAGAWGNDIRVQVETGSSTGKIAACDYGKKISVQHSSDDATVGDNIHRAMLAVICTDAAASACALTIAPITAGGVAGTLATTVTGGTAANLSLSLATYDTLQKLSDEINRHSGYKATVLEGHGTDPSIWIDACTAVGIWGQTTLDVAATAGDVLVRVAATTALAVGDYVYLKDKTTAAINEIVRVGSIDTGVSFTIDSTYSPNGLTFSYLDASYVSAKGAQNNGDLYACYLWFNSTVGDIIVATRKVASTEGTLPPTNLAYTNLAGGADGSMTLAKLSTALDAILEEEVNILCVNSSNAAWHAAMAAHCQAQNLYNPRMAVVGGATAETVAQRKARCAALNTECAVEVVEGHYDFTSDGSGAIELLSPVYSAAAVAGLIAGLEIPDSPTRKTLAFLGLENNYTPDQRGDFIEAGGLCFRFIKGRGYVVTQGVNTLSATMSLWDAPSNSSPEISLTRIKFQFMHEFRVKADNIVPGSNPTRMRHGDVSSLAISHCSYAQKEGWIARTEADKDNPQGLPAYDPPIVRKAEDAWYVDFNLRFANPNNYLFFSVSVVG